MRGGIFHPATSMWTNTATTRAGNITFSLSIHHREKLKPIEQDNQNPAKGIIMVDTAIAAAVFSTLPRPNVRTNID